MSVATKSPPQDRRLAKFFRTELLRISRQYRRESRELMAGSPDSQLASYYVVREKTKMTKADFENGSCASPDELASALSDMWDEQGFTELSSVAPQFAKLAERLKKSQLESDEVSPFIYVMY